MLYYLQKRQALLSLFTSYHDIIADSDRAKPCRFRLILEQTTPASLALSLLACAPSSLNTASATLSLSAKRSLVILLLLQGARPCPAGQGRRADPHECASHEWGEATPKGAEVSPRAEPVGEGEATGGRRGAKPLAVYIYPCFSLSPIYL